MTSPDFTQYSKQQLIEALANTDVKPSPQEIALIELELTKFETQQTEPAIKEFFHVENEPVSMSLVKGMDPLVYGFICGCLAILIFPMTDIKNYLDGVASTVSETLGVRLFFSVLCGYVCIKNIGRWFTKRKSKNNKPQQ
ncbi:hypothetical protein KO525_11815 [Psychrosphaera sp. B3R10]|uniref:hypothetical protein n=1 Tax=unclassified Psychrosphaera TaxID=2641570 RepID=UPI001C08BDA5|nr:MULTISPECIES: hypothetical protein [unclassified Psychrosphaera]MBU2881223.1 hypothetical protein [Psychrosphaera sp. I2R16]MBU2990066.1 hypothetical protein [Psychrosphaera sp. B3R10]